MKKLLRFKPVEIDSRVCFFEKHRKIHHYHVRSIALIPRQASHADQQEAVPFPEIFWH